MTPRLDVCSRCERLRGAVVAAVGEEAKLEACRNLTDHVHDAQTERDFYKQTTINARTELQAVPSMPSDSIDPPDYSHLSHVHYTFNFAQNVFLPNTARQEGPLYFKTPRKVQLFGICNEAIPRQVNYLLDESDTIGIDGKKCHNPNTVVSLLHHYFEAHGLKEAECFLHADNCAGQNKNKTVMAYFAWRCITGRHKKIPLSFMVTGHTRCLVDGMFGFLKRKYRRADCYSMGQLASVVDSSAQSNVAQTIPGSSVIWRDWDKFLPQFFRPIPGVSQFHHFVFEAAMPGVVKVKRRVGDEFEDVSLVKPSAPPVVSAVLPDVIPAGGISCERQAYLFKEIRPFVPDEFADELCPPLPDIVWSLVAGFYASILM